MVKGLRSEFVFQLFALLIVFILVHSAYLALIRPKAEQHIREQQQLLSNDPGHIEQQSMYVVLRDYEQETCLILFLWAMAILIYKSVSVLRQQQQLHQDLLHIPPDLPIGREDIRELNQRLSSYPEVQQHFLLLRGMQTALERYAVSNTIQDVATAVKNLCESQADRQESELSIIRYIAWAIPSVGFIGTVRGIGNALGQAHRAVEGDITGVTQALGVAFNSTFVALVISIFLMFFIHQVQLMQERLVLDCENYIDHRLIKRLKL